MPTDLEPSSPEPVATAPLPTQVVVDATYSLPGIAFCCAAGEPPTTIYAGLSDFAIHRIDTAAEKPQPIRLGEASHDSYVTGLVRAGDRLISGGYDGALIWWNAADGEQLRRIETAHDKWIRGLAITPDATRLVSVADDMRTKVWDVATGEQIADWGDHEVKTPQGYPSMLYAVALSSDGQWLATGDKTGEVLVREFSGAAGSIVARLQTPVMYTWDPRARNHSIGGIRSLAFSNDGQSLAIGGMGKVNNIDHLEGPSRLEIFDWQAGVKLHEIEDTQFKGLVEALRFAPDDRWLVAAGGDHSGFVSIYEVGEGKLLAQSKTGSHVHDISLAPDATSLVTVGHQQATKVLL